MRSADAIVVGGGIIGLSLALELRRSGLSVMVIERGEPGREASHAAAGMLAPTGGHSEAALHELAQASVRIYPEFVAEVEAESGIHVDLRRQGTIVVDEGEVLPSDAQRLTCDDVRRLEPTLQLTCSGAFLQEQTVDPPSLTRAVLEAARKRGVEIISGSAVTEITTDAAGFEVHTLRTKYQSSVVVNCAGAWAAAIGPVKLPVRPVKGQMLSAIPVHAARVAHVIRAPQVYVVPRSDGRMLIGATVEEAGFDKRVQPEVIQSLLRQAADFIPALRDAKMHDAWAGLRPAAPDNLPIMSATSVPGYFVSSGHFRNGILLAPMAARVMAQLITGHTPECDLSLLSASRFMAS